MYTHTHIYIDISCSGEAESFLDENCACVRDASERDAENQRRLRIHANEKINVDVGWVYRRVSKADVDE